MNTVFSFLFLIYSFINRCQFFYTCKIISAGNQNFFSKVNLTYYNASSVFKKIFFVFNSVKFEWYFSIMQLYSENEKEIFKKKKKYRCKEILIDAKLFFHETVLYVWVWGFGLLYGGCRRWFTR